MIAAVTLLLAGMLLTAGCTQGGDEPAGEADLAPSHTVFELDVPVENIFTVPRPNAVGTNSVNNAVSLLRLQQNGVAIEPIARDFVSNVGLGEFVFLPPLSKDAIAWTQLRRLLMVDLRSGEHREIQICDLLEEHIEAADVLGGGSLMFQVVTTFDDRPPQLALQTWDVRTPEGMRTGSLALALDAVVSGSRSHVIVASGSGIAAYDTRLSPAPHPLTAAAERILRPPAGGGEMILSDLLLHPYAPLALFSFEEGTIRIVTWSAQGKVQVMRWPYGPASFFESHPAGSHFAFWRRGEDGAVQLFVTRVEPASEARFTTPQYLGTFSDVALPEQLAWTSEPHGLALLDPLAGTLTHWPLP